MHLKMHLKALVTLMALLPGTAAFAVGSEHGDWAATRIGQTCYVHTLRAAKDTSGTLIFGFQDGGYNASFTYEYAPYEGETGAPWGPDDLVELTIDNEAIWLGEEMFTDFGPTGYVASMTAGMVPEMISYLLNASDRIDVAFDRADLGEVWLYGMFSPYGFAESLNAAGQMCWFDPRNLPAS